jgi:hypothetical protein
MAAVSGRKKSLLVLGKFWSLRSVDMSKTLLRKKVFPKKITNQWIYCACSLAQTEGIEDKKMNMIMDPNKKYDLLKQHCRPTSI